MRFAPSLCALALLCLLPSCMSGGLATAALAGSGMATNLPGVKSLLGKDAPKPAEMVGRSVDYSGECRGADNIGRPARGSILFGHTHPTVAYLPDGTTRSTAYTRLNDEKALITITTAAGVENFRLTFTDGQSGTYTYEKRHHGSDFATGEGHFTLQ